MHNNFIELGANNTSVHNNESEGKACGLKFEPTRNLMDACSNKEGSIIDGIISQGLAVLAGKNGCGISTLALDMALGIAGDRDFLGRKTGHGNAIYISMGDSRARMQARLDGPAPGNLDIACHAGCSWAELNEFLNTYLQGHPGTKAAIIDMVQKPPKAPETASRDGYAHDYAGIESLKRLADKYGTAIILAAQCRQTGDRNGCLGGIQEVLAWQGQQMPYWCWNRMGANALKGHSPSWAGAWLEKCFLSGWMQGIQNGAAWALWKSWMHAIPANSLIATRYGRASPLTVA